jgi:hypothetical protein
LLPWRGLRYTRCRTAQIRTISAVFILVSRMAEIRDCEDEAASEMGEIRADAKFPDVKEGAGVAEVFVEG